KTGGEAPAKTMPATDREAAGGLKLSPAGKPRAEKPVTTAIPPSQSWPRLLTREQTLARLDTVSTGKTIAGVVAQVIAVASSPTTDLSDLVRVISGDPLLASRVVMLANSASTGSRARVSTVEDAARAVGVRGI